MKQKFYCNLQFECLTSCFSFFFMARSYTWFFVNIFQKQAFCLYFLHFLLIFEYLLWQKFSIYLSFVFLKYTIRAFCNKSVINKVWISEINFLVHRVTFHGIAQTLMAVHSEGRVIGCAQRQYRTEFNLTATKVLIYGIVRHVSITYGFSLKIKIKISK